MLQKIAVIAVWRKQKPTCCEIARIDYQRITRFSERKTYANLPISSQLLHDTSFFSNFASDFGRAIPSSLKSDTLLINITELSMKKYVSAIFSEPQIIHSKDKIYLKDEATGQYICVLQKGVGIIYMEDNAGHTWNALWYCVFCVTSRYVTQKK